MSYVSAAPAMMTAAATDLADIGSSLSEARAVAAASTTNVIPAGADEVSTAIASLFSSHGKAFQALSAQATTPGNGTCVSVRRRNRNVLTAAARCHRGAGRVRVLAQIGSAA